MLYPLLLHFASKEDIAQAIVDLPSKMGYILFCYILPLYSVAAQVEVNKMGPLNLGVVFGPTLMRPDDESAGHIQNIAFQNCVGKPR